MKTQVLTACVKFFALAIIGSILSFPALSDTDNATLTQEKMRLELEASIEKSKAEIAGYKKTQREAETLAELGIRQKEAEAKKAEAEAEKGEILAKLPPTKIEALPGSIDAKNLGAAGLIMAVDLAKELAPRLCEVIDQNQTALVYDATTTSGLISARLFGAQIALFQESLNKALKEKDDRKAISDFRISSKSIGMGAVVATGTIKAVADLASLFKTNITVSKTDFTEAKSLILTAMASNCPEKLTSLGFGYAGELDTTEFDGLREKAMLLLNDRAQLEIRVVNAKKALDEEKEPAKKKSLQAQFDDLSAVGKLVDGFIAAIKLNETSDKSPLSVAAKYLALSKRTANSNILDIDFKLEGLTIIKENIFTGQKLRLSATAITWYRLHDKAGKIIKAGVWRGMAKPVQVDLRGMDANDAFWSKQ